MSHPERLRQRSREQRQRFQQAGGGIDIRELIVAQFIGVLVAELAVDLILQ